jgi:hypothetical protein
MALLNSSFQAPRWFRQTHRWVAMAAALPAGLIFLTGMLLSLRAVLPGMQRSTVPGSAPGWALSREQILEAARTASGLEGLEWSDVQKVEIAPEHGVIKLRTRSYQELQIDAHTGQVLASGFRPTSLVLALHEGAAFPRWVRWTVFVPAGFLLLYLWLSGVLLFLKWRGFAHGKGKNDVGIGHGTIRV